MKTSLRFYKSDLIRFYNNVSSVDRLFYGMWTLFLLMAFGVPVIGYLLNF